MNQTSINESARAPYRWSRQAQHFLAFALAMFSCATFAAAPTNEGGEYTYSTSVA